MRKMHLRAQFLMMILILGSIFTTPLHGDASSENHWIVRKKREGGSLWLVDPKKQPVMEIQGSVNNHLEQIPAGRVVDPDLRAKLMHFSLNAKREVDEAKSLSISSQGHYGILIDKTVTMPEIPGYARTPAERATRPWPSGVNLEREFSTYKPPFLGSTTSQVTIFDRDGKTVFSKSFSDPSIRITIDDSQSPVWMQLQLGTQGSAPQLIELNR